ncbi:MAG: hypothetical protein ACREQO_16815, partial [Candidatus Binatia bacterium]
MKLITAHKILIASSTVFFLFLSLWELQSYFASSDSWAMGRSLLYLLVAIGFGIYFKNLPRLY